MNSSKKITLFFIISFACVCFFIAGRLSAPSVDHHHTADANHQLSETFKSSLSEERSQTWTCSMHPQIQQHEPGQCPICGMDLVAHQHHQHDTDAPVLVLSERATKLAEIQTVEVSRGVPTARLRMVGKLAYDQTRVRSLTARFPARIDRLFVNYIGVPVKRGEHLAKIYSSELFSAENELLTAHRFNPSGPAARAAREKLRLWDLLPSQIDEIVARNKASELFELLAPIGGVVVQKNVNEGDYVQAGESLLTIVDLSELWLKLQAYESDLYWLRLGQKIQFSVNAFPGETFEGFISFIAPEVDEYTRTIAVRVNVVNKQKKLKPGMLATAEILSEVTRSGSVYSDRLSGKWISPMHPEIIKDQPGQCDICGMDLVPIEAFKSGHSGDVIKPILVPRTAVLRTGKRAVVYLKTSDDPIRFEGREIQLGPLAGQFYVVSSGLNEGERVVTNGAFKIDSALQIQAKPSMMNPSEHTDHSHSLKDESIQDSSEQTSPVLKIKADYSERLLATYLDLHDALASDDYDRAHKAVLAALDQVKSDDQLYTFFKDMSEKNSLSLLRRPDFEHFSNAILDYLKQSSEPLEQPLYEMYCPMVYRGRGAHWLQADKQLRNPYFGASMLKCGEVKGLVAPSAVSSDAEPDNAF